VVGETSKERVDRFRKRADEARLVASDMKDRDASEAMRAAAAVWDEMADQEERRSIQNEPANAASSSPRPPQCGGASATPRAEAGR
jgi:hypothetical protein